MLGLGCNNFGMKLDAEASRAVVAAALDAGVTHFDTAEMYGDGKSEEYLGAALAGHRDETVIATKYLPRPHDEAYTPGVLAARIREACELSLRRLGTDRIDVYYQHYPVPEAPVEEVVETLDELVRAGKVLRVATSNVDPDHQRLPPGCREARARPLHRGAGRVEPALTRRGVVPAARTAGMGVVPYSRSPPACSQASTPQGSPTPKDRASRSSRTSPRWRPRRTTARSNS